MKQHKIPFAYFLTFRSYGTWLHGDHKGSVDKNHNVFDTPYIKPNKIRYQRMQKKLKHSETLFNTHQRKIILDAILHTCRHFEWYLYAAHVRSNHIHLLLNSTAQPEEILRKIKAHASRELNKQGISTQKQQYWSHHGSTRYVFCENHLYPIMRYIILAQGDNQVCYYDAWFDQYDFSDFL